MSLARAQVVALPFFTAGAAQRASLQQQVPRVREMQDLLGGAVEAAPHQDPEYKGRWGSSYSELLSTSSACNALICVLLILEHEDGRV